MTGVSYPLRGELRYFSRHGGWPVSAALPELLADLVQATAGLHERGEAVEALTVYPSGTDGWSAVLLVQHDV